MLELDSNAWVVLTDSIAAVLLILGASLSTIAGIGLLRFPDQLSRMHAGTKPQVLGLLLMLLALAFAWRAWVWIPVLLLAWVLQMLTAPVSAHLVGRASYRTKHLNRDLLYVDELADVVTRQDDEGQPAEKASDQQSVPRQDRNDGY
ncbi:monovalent cation/H(+) antiporter subunit G [Micrococcus terreus]|uniref:monovalent cation/H(+) antiporter subunit G n=1 Tax=Micrococcus terreus TaxID=574650 RepID=UPI0021A81E6D|nr:monovalent cation/H(+) antiporter subunit G [Micrococcus terreus]MCT2088662.1 monovalent cation/H(+) antiporter subunit G [Micrococcus terreus]MDK7701599.1 monovalent cation/H(+) antiporter subunit G [Micrococcus terreus]WOO96617.1 monovalent cation/H(+) antiporter subunit G [Micrococcus terreus]